MTSPPTPVRLIERLAHRNALAVRFRDVHTGEWIVSGLSVRAIVAGSARLFEARATASGVYTVRWLPGVGPCQTRAVDAAGVEASVPVRPVDVVIDVRDRFDRFLPCVLSATLPVDWLIDVEAASPLSPLAGDSPGVPLYSAPGRRLPAGLAVVRASLVRSADGRPAAHAALEVVPEPGAAAVRGVADERGEVVVAFPYPAPPRRLGSPPTATKVALSGTTWTVGVGAYLPRRPPGSPPALDRLLDQRPAALTSTIPPLPAVAQAEVSYRRECVLRSSSAHAELAVGP